MFSDFSKWTSETRDIVANARDDKRFPAQWETDRTSTQKKVEVPLSRGPTSDPEVFRTAFWVWLNQRGLTHYLEHEYTDELDRYCVYRCVASKFFHHIFDGGRCERTFHGLNWYGLGMMLRAESILASEDIAAGHRLLDGWPGVCSTPHRDTAYGYATPTTVFRDGVYHRVMVEAVVDNTLSEFKKKGDQGNNESWVHPEGAVVIRAIWLFYNHPPRSGEERHVSYRPELEALWPGRTLPYYPIELIPSETGEERFFIREDKPTAYGEANPCIGVVPAKASGVTLATRHQFMPAVKRAPSAKARHYPSCIICGSMMTVVKEERLYKCELCNRKVTFAVQNSKVAMQSLAKYLEPPAQERKVTFAVPDSESAGVPEDGALDTRAKMKRVNSESRASYAQP